MKNIYKKKQITNEYEHENNAVTLQIGALLASLPTSSSFLGLLLNTGLQRYPHRIIRGHPVTSQSLFNWTERVITAQTLVPGL